MDDLGLVLPCRNHAKMYDMGTTLHGNLIRHRLDFNEKKLYRKTGLDFKTDNYDDGHGTLWGKEGNEADWPGAGTVVWHGRAYGQPVGNDKGILRRHKEDCGMPYVTDMEEYTAVLQDERYSVFISAMDECVRPVKRIL